MNENRLQFWIENGYNVLLTGKHGVGKSSIVLDAFKKAGLNYQYFSASTMDPWVDFIGVPKEKQDKNGSYLELVRPKSFQDDNVEAIFLDEFNRAPKKVRNAVMELIQFKSINGKKFNKLKIIWAAINPEEQNDDLNELEYDVEKLDPAQKDRFHIHVNIPYKPDAIYFKNKYKENGNVAVKWWHSLTTEAKNNISPRRLDYALQVFIDGGDIKDVFPSNINTSDLINLLTNSNTFKEMEKIYRNKNTEKAKTFIQQPNNYSMVKDVLNNATNQQKEFWIPKLPPETISQLMEEKGNLTSWIIKNAGKQREIDSVLREIIKANINQKLIQKIKRVYKANGKNHIIGDLITKKERKDNVDQSMNILINSINKVVKQEETYNKFKKLIDINKVEKVINGIKLSFPTTYNSSKRKLCTLDVLVEPYVLNTNTTIAQELTEIEIMYAILSTLQEFSAPTLQSKSFTGQMKKDSQRLFRKDIPNTLINLKKEEIIALTEMVENYKKPTNNRLMKYVKSVI